MQGGLGHGTGNACGNRFHILFRHAFQFPLLHRLQGNLPAFFKNRHPGSVLHAVNKTIDLLLLDLLKVIADREIKDDAVLSPQPEFPGDHMDHEPGFDIFLKSLPDLQFRRPFAVVSLIGRQDAGLRDTGRQIPAVHILYRLQFKPAGTRRISGDQVLAQLCIGACRRSEHRLDAALKDGEESPSSFHNL